MYSLSIAEKTSVAALTGLTLDVFAVAGVAALTDDGLNGDRTGSKAQRRHLQHRCPGAPGTQQSTLQEAKGPKGDDFKHDSEAKPKYAEICER